MATSVSRFSWVEEYSVHVEDLDVQHQRLTALLSDLHHMASYRAPVEAARAFDDFIRYAEIHFADEEQFMERHGYPEAAHHAAAHRLLMNRFLSMLSAYQAQGKLAPGTVESMFEALELHMREDDQRYCTYFGLR